MDYSTKTYINPETPVVLRTCVFVCLTVIVCKHPCRSTIQIHNTACNSPFGNKPKIIFDEHLITCHPFNPFYPWTQHDHRIVFCVYVF